MLLLVTSSNYPMQVAPNVWFLGEPISFGYLKDHLKNHPNLMLLHCQDIPSVVLFCSLPEPDPKSFHTWSFTWSLTNSRLETWSYAA